MHNPAPLQENDTHKLLWDFNIQMKRNYKIVDFAIPADNKIKLKE